MSTRPLNEQEAFWAGDFGTQYSHRNVGRIDTNRAFFREVFSHMDAVRSIMEFGCGTGENLAAISKLGKQDLSLYGVEINHEAARRIPVGKIFECSVHDFPLREQYDLVITKGFLIHVEPDRLPNVYDKLFAASKRYILIAEYFAPTVTPVEYRGLKNKLWRNDFAGAMLDRFPGQLSTPAYGFCYKRDEYFGQDNLNWFLLEKIL